MSNIFDINRFWNFLLYDLRRARNNYGISMLLLGLTIKEAMFIFRSPDRLNP